MSNCQHVEIDVLEIPCVCLSIMKVAKRELRRDLLCKGIELAGTVVSKMEMQDLGVLIGSDHYWKDLSGKLERLSEQVVGLYSKLSWLIQRTESMLNVTSDQEIRDIGTLHVSVGLEQ